jgi:type VI secretion system secreted protein VgrG
MAYTQGNRLIAIETPLGKDALLLASFSGAEGLSAPFSFELALLSENHSISFQDIVGKNVTISVVLANGDKRFFNGIVSRFAQGRGGDEAGGDPRFSAYRATMVPTLWLLSRTTDSRIFQKLSVPDIVEKIFGEYGLSDFKMKQLQNSHPKREYCVQYRESDFHFISRILEEDGIYYYFEHEDGKHTMIMADVPQGHSTCPTQEVAKYQISGGARLKEDVITALEWSQEVRSGKYTMNDYNFEIPKTSLEVNVPGRRKLGPWEREIYYYPGSYDTRSEGDRVVNLRMEEEEAQITRIRGESGCRAFTSGYRFTLSEFYRNDMNNKEYVLTSLAHEARQEFQGDTTDLSYTNSFTCIPFDVPFRPKRTHIKPTVQGSQTAIVVGPKGEEIFTDKHSRVKVQFHWDREGKKDENSSCWIRVSQPWAGPGWGALSIPRIGHEVVVDFIEGDPDRPIITGSVYHGNNKPPYPLPDEKTTSTIKSDSSLGGNGFNEIRFQDKKGKEQIFMHAERDMDVRVKKEMREYIGQSRHLIVDKDMKETITNDCHVHVKGKLSEKVGTDSSLTVGTSLQEKVGTLWAVDSGQEIHLKAGMKVVIEAGLELTIKGPGGFVKIDPMGVTIVGNMVLINSGGSAGSGSGASPTDPGGPDTADDGSKFDKL